MSHQADNMVPINDPCSGNISNNKENVINETLVREESLMYLETNDRTIFFIVFLCIYIVAFTGNVFAVYATIGRNSRCIQKFCIISLSLSDLVMSTAYAINHLETFSHPLINWTIGEFMCKSIPMAQIAGLIANSITLVIIALDRYQNLVHALKKRWNPELWKCIVGLLFIWAISLATSYPMYTYFQNRPIKIFYSNRTISEEHVYLCVSTMKDSMYHYYVCIASLIFLPTLTVFIWLYYNIAQLIWNHRKPLHLRLKQNNSTPETSISNLRSTDSLTTNPQPSKAVPIKKKNIHVERKIRTFKIIVALMLVFILCRLPFWIFTILKLETNTYNQHYHWILTYVFTALALLNCALNPFLYTFLESTVRTVTVFCKAANDFTCKVCCCCISNTEFEEFERENPFIIERYQRTRSQKNCDRFAPVRANHAFINQLPEGYNHM